MFADLGMAAAELLVADGQQWLLAVDAHRTADTDDDDDGGGEPSWTLRRA